MRPAVSGRAMPVAPNRREVPKEPASGSGRFAPGHSCQSIRSPACLGRARPSARFPTFRRDRSRRPLQVRAASRDRPARGRPFVPHCRSSGMPCPAPRPGQAAPRQTGQSGCSRHGRAQCRPAPRPGGQPAGSSPAPSPACGQQRTHQRAEAAARDISIASSRPPSCSGLRTRFTPSPRRDCGLHLGRWAPAAHEYDAPGGEHWGRGTLALGREGMSELALLVLHRRVRSGVLRASPGSTP